MQTRWLALVGLVLAAQMASASIADGEWAGGGFAGGAARQISAIAPTTVADCSGGSCPPRAHRPTPAEYGVCPKYTVKQGDILFDIAKKLGVEAGACGSNGRAWVVGLGQPASQPQAVVVPRHTLGLGLG